MTLAALVEKEVHDLVREKRFGAWAITYTLVWTVVLFVVMVETRARAQSGGSIDGVSGPAEMFYFITVIALAVLALFICTDAVCRERESGTLPLVAVTPVERSHVLLSKIVAAGVAYVASMGVVLVATSALAYVYGVTLLKVTLALYAIPFLAFYVFAAGLGLFLSVVMTSSKVAIGTAAGLYFPLFFLNPYMPLEQLFGGYPVIVELAAFTPFHAAQLASEAILHGGYLPWGGLAATAGAGLVAGAAAFVVFARQEAAA